MGRRTLPVLSVIAVAATSLAAGAHFVSGAGTGTETVFVPTTPCRLIDTRPNNDASPDQNVGPRSTPIGAGETVEFAALDGSDANSPCEIPASATAISTNTVAISPTARSFMTLFPSDVENPGTANLNYVANQAPTPNAATVPLSATGTFNVYNFDGNVHLVMDVSGYYQPSSSAGSAGAAGPTGPAGPAGPQGSAGADGSNGAAGADGSNGPVPGTPCDSPAGPAQINAGFNNKGAYYTACGDLTLTYAGAGGFAFSVPVGNRATATFSTPFDVDVSATGALVISENALHRIRTVSPSGAVSVLAGPSIPSADFIDGTGAAARFNGPSGVVRDASGNVFVADTGNHSIRKITPAGVVTTLAGNGTADFINGLGDVARFSSPQGIAIDTAGNLYVADTGNHSIRKITPAGDVTTLAGNGAPGFVDDTGSTAQFSGPLALDVAADGRVYVVDAGNFRIRRVTPVGVVTTIAGPGTTPGSTADGPLATASLGSVFGIAVAGPGQILVTDGFPGIDARIRRVTTDGITTVAGGAAESGPMTLPADGGDATFAFLRGIDIDADGNVFVADQTTNTIREVLGIT